MLRDEAFYCGTGAQVSPVVNIDNRDLATARSDLFPKNYKIYILTVSKDVFLNTKLVYAYL